MKFTKIQGVLVNLETVTKISLHYNEIWVRYVNGDRDEYDFTGERGAAIEFERLENLIFDIQRGNHG